MPQCPQNLSIILVYIEIQIDIKKQKCENGDAFYYSFGLAEAEEIYLRCEIKRDQMCVICMCGRNVRGKRFLRRSQVRFHGHVGDETRLAINPTIEKKTTTKNN